jgi:23S rRNA U2552 (ribose-2'-O)-methylase RlmE/FtsJ
VLKTHKGITIYIKKMVKKLVLEVGGESKNQYPNCETILEINDSLFDIITTYKNKINEYYKNKSWDRYKKLSNEYELIFFSSNSSNNISLYNPVSRSFFKLWEILEDFKEEIKIHQPTPLKCVFLAEGPGGFYEAFHEKRKEYKDECFGITLRSSNKSVPDWKTNKLFPIHISYGKDGTGNLYNIENIEYFANYVGRNTVDFITADGGFDFSSDFNNQEEQSFRLILSEVLSALLLQKEGGSFLLKLYDCFNTETLKLLHILRHHYKKLYFIKPLTSRPANSERYLLCYDFQYASINTFADNIGILKKLVTHYETINIKNEMMNVPYDMSLLDNIVMFNLYYTMRQVYYIQRTINYILFFKKRNEEIIKAIIDKHKSKSIKWCQKYHIPYREEVCNANIMAISQ